MRFYSARYKPMRSRCLEARAQEVVEENSKEEETKDENSKRKVAQPNYVLDVVGQRHGNRAVVSFRARSISTAPTCCLTVSLSSTSEETSRPTARYSDFKDFQGIPFPTHILIQRPEEEYTIGLMITKLTLNNAFHARPVPVGSTPRSAGHTLDGSQAKGSSSATRSLRLRARACFTNVTA